jgi:hypothetical protein
MLARALSPRLSRTVAKRITVSEKFEVDTFRNCSPGPAPLEMQMKIGGTIFDPGSSVVARESSIPCRRSVG